MTDFRFQTFDFLCKTRGLLTRAQPCGYPITQRGLGKMNLPHDPGRPCWMASGVIFDLTAKLLGPFEFWSILQSCFRTPSPPSPLITTQELSPCIKEGCPLSRLSHSLEKCLPSLWIEEFKCLCVRALRAPPHCSPTLCAAVD